MKTHSSSAMPESPSIEGGVGVGLLGGISFLRALLLIGSALALIG